jgi:AbrB family looped-hinge helix DNA binding protein
MPGAQYDSLLKVRSIKFMSTATLTSKGQITVPKSVRERLGLGAGDRVEFVETEGGFMLRTATRDIRSLKGLLPRPKQPVTVEAMNSAITRMGRERS